MKLAEIARANTGNAYGPATAHVTSIASATASATSTVPAAPPRSRVRQSPPATVSSTARRRMLIGLSSRDHRPTRVYVRANWNAPGVCYSIVTRARTTKFMLIIIKMDGEKQINFQCTRYSRLLALTRAMIRRNCLYWTYDRSSITDLCKLVITSAPLVCIAGSRQRISNETLKIHGVCYVWFDCRM